MGDISTYSKQDSSNENKYLEDIAKHVYNHNNCMGLHINDLINEGWIALQEKKQRYNQGHPKGATLETYAYKGVKGAMLDLINSYKPRGYRRKFRPGEPSPVCSIEYNDALNGNRSDHEGFVVVGEVNRAMETLSQRDRTILIARAEGEWLKVLSKKHNISMTRITQICNETREKIEKEMEG